MGIQHERRKWRIGVKLGIKWRITPSSRRQRKENVPFKNPPYLCFVSSDEKGFPLQTAREVMSSFPNSQHRPVIIEVGLSIPIITSTQRPRWNFRKANWNKYADAAIRFISPAPTNYNRFANLVISTAKKCYRKEYIHCWSEDSDSIYPEFLTFCGPRTRLWLARFFTNVMMWNTFPHYFKQTKIIALLKPGKPDDNPASYRPIALLSVALKLFKRLLLNRITPDIDKLVPPEQAGFRKNRSCAEQVMALTNYIEN